LNRVLEQDAHGVVHHYAPRRDRRADATTGIGNLSHVEAVAVFAESDGRHAHLLPSKPNLLDYFFDVSANIAS